MNLTILRLGLAVAAVSLILGTASAQDVKWDLSNEYPATSLFGEGDTFFAKRLMDLSDGKIDVTVHFGGALGYKSKDHFDAVSDGAIPLADSYTGTWQGIDPIFILSSLPFLAATIEQARILYEVAKPDYEAVFKKYNQKLLYAGPWPPNGLWSKKPLDSLAALKNLRMRTSDPNSTRTFRAAGAAPIQMSWADVIPQLATGGIDAVLTSAEGGVNGKFWEHLSHFNEINYSMSLNMTHMNLDAYNKLPTDLKKAVDQAARDAESHLWESVVNRQANNYKTLRSKGVAVVTGIPMEYLKELSKAGEPTHENWVKKMGERGKKIFTDYRKRLDK